MFGGKKKATYYIHGGTMYEYLECGDFLIFIFDFDLKNKSTCVLMAKDRGDWVAYLESGR